MYRITNPNGISIFFITTKSSAILPEMKELRKRKAKNNKNNRVGFINNFLKSFIVTIIRKATTKTPNKIFGNALI